MPLDRKQWHFGVLSFTGTGHINPLIALSLELKRRGHRVTFFEKQKIEARVREAGLEFSPIEKGESPQGKKQDADDTGVFSDIPKLRFNLRRVVDDLRIFLEQLPPAIRGKDVDALIVNEIALTGPTVAELLRVPYFVISTSVPHNFGWNFYRWFFGYRLSTSRLTWLERRLLELSVFHMRGPILRAIDDFRRRAGLGRQRHLVTTYPALAHITQLPECLDLPHAAPPENFHYAGPFLDSAARSVVDFPWESLDRRPMIYASLGTTRNAQPDLLRLIAEACSDLDAQLVISLGGRFAPERFTGLPGSPLVVKFAPQLELLKRAAVVISHCGMNTVLEALLEGKPIIAIPIAYDQPAIAARLERKKAAIVLPIMRLSAQRIRAALTKLLHDTSYSDAARALQAKLRTLRGSEYATNVIERALEDYTQSHSTRSNLREMTAIRKRNALLDRLEF
jgi:zeaxanthin glucosyltransferase